MITYEQLEKAIRPLLDNGETPDKMAFYLEGEGCQGAQHAVFSCPVATFLRQALGERILVDGEQLCTDDVSMPTPPEVHDFIAKFDFGAYPQLVKEGGGVMVDQRVSVQQLETAILTLTDVSMFSEYVTNVDRDDIRRVIRILASLIERGGVE